jgi:hypothetical protein
MLVHVFAGIAVEGLPAPGRNIGKNFGNTEDNF